MTREGTPTHGLASSFVHSPPSSFPSVTPVTTTFASRFFSSIHWLSDLSKQTVPQPLIVSLPRDGTHGRRVSAISRLPSNATPRSLSLPHECMNAKRVHACMLPPPFLSLFLFFFSLFVCLFVCLLDKSVGIGHTTITGYKGGPRSKN